MGSLSLTSSLNPNLRDDKELVDMFQCGFFQKQLEDLKKVMDDLIKKTYKSKQCFAGFKKKIKIKSLEAFQETVNYVGFADKDYGEQQKFECPCHVYRL